MIKNFYCLTWLLLCGYFGMFAQSNKEKASLFGNAEYVREIPPISEMKNVISAKWMGKNGQEKRRGINTFVPGKGLPLPGQKDPLIDLRKSATVRSPIVTEIANFDTHQGFSTPTDPTGAVGPNHYVYAFNTGFGIRDKQGNELVGEASLATIFPGESLGDPIVIYDNFAERFVVMQFSNSPNGILIAVCKGSDPVNNGWYTYRFNTGSFPDYEKLSIWNDGYYITANKDQFSASRSEVVYAVERDKMLIGDPDAKFVGFPLPGVSTSGFYSPGGSHVTGPNLPPLGVGHSVVYLQDDSWSGVNFDHIKVWTTDVDWNDVSNSTISRPQTLATSAFDSVFDGGSFINLPQPNGSDIDALQATMMYMTTYRRFSGHNSMIFNFVVDLDGNDDLAGIRWYELRQSADGQPWSIYQEGTYAQPDGFSAFGGSMAIDAQGNIGLGYTTVSKNSFPSIRYTGRVAGDPLGTMTLIEKIAVNGSRSNPSFRYGDYAHMTIDPTDDETFWHIAEYFDNGFRKNRVVAFRLKSAVPDTQAPTSPTGLGVSNITDVSLILRWIPSTDNIGVTGYDIYRNGQLQETTTSTSALISGLSPETAYDFYVVAKDAAGNLSAPSETFTATTSAPDTEAPDVPTDLIAINTTSSQTTLRWSAAADNVGVVNYIVVQDGNPVETVSDTTVKIVGLFPETTYVFSVLAIDAVGNESEPSIPIRVTTAAATGCSDGIALPYSESFELSLSNWTQSKEDDIDWIINSGSTPSRGTGPRSASDGEQYIYVEASGNFVGYPNKKAILTSNCIDLTGAAKALFSFDYHMYGAQNFGSLALEASNDGENWNTIWSKSGNQGNSWKTAVVDLENYLGTGTQFRFNRITGSTWRADAAIDAIKINSEGIGIQNNCANAELTLTIDFDGFPQENSWLILDAFDNVVRSKSYPEEFKQSVVEKITGLESGNYTFMIVDEFGDGMCCEYGSGSYTLSSNTTVIAKGSKFKNGESTNFCIQAAQAKIATYDLDDMDKTNHKFKIYPIPATTVLHIDKMEEKPIQEIEIYSMYGQQVKHLKRKENLYQVDISTLPAGTYFIRITAEEEFVTRSFAIKR